MRHPGSRRFTKGFLITTPGITIRDGIAFDPIEVEPCPDRPGFYRHLDGVHRWNAYKATGVETIQNHLGDLATLPNLLNADLSRGFTVAQVAEKHGWHSSMLTGGIFRIRRHQKKNIKAASS